MAYFGKVQYDKMNKSMAQMEVTLLQSRETIKRLEKERDKFENAGKEYQEKLNEREQDKERLIGILQKHDLTRLVMAKPGLIEKRINNGIKQLWEDFESASGKPVVD